jgi:hypothetical protein
MSFHHNNQQFSDKEIADAAKAKKQERHQWCEQQAREFFATKERRKFYYCTYFIPEVEHHKYFAFPKEQEEEIRSAMNQQIAEGFDPDLQEILSDIEIFVEGDDNEPEGMLTDIDFDDYLYCYHIGVRQFDPVSGEEEKADIRMTALTDEEYIQVLTELLYSPHVLSFDGLRRVLPEICQKIAKDCTKEDTTTALFLEEMNQDVDAILEQHGGREKTPYVNLFNNPFIQLAEYNAAKG